jgi:hypothetical protein
VHHRSHARPFLSTQGLHRVEEKQQAQERLEDPAHARGEHSGSEQRLCAESVVLGEGTTDRLQDDPRDEEVEARLEQELAQLDARAVIEAAQETDAAAGGTERCERSPGDRTRRREHFLRCEARGTRASAGATRRASASRSDLARRRRPRCRSRDGQALHGEGERHHDGRRVVELDAAVAFHVSLVQPAPAERIDHLEGEVQARIELRWRPLPEEEGAGEEEHEREREDQDRPAGPRPDREARAREEHDRRQSEHEARTPVVHEGERTDVLASFGVGLRVLEQHRQPEVDAEQHDEDDERGRELAPHVFNGS